MKKDHPPSWQKMHDAQKEKAREQILKLMESSKSYPRPPSDPHIILTSVGNRIGLIDIKTGDVLIHVGSSPYEGTESFQFTTKSGEIVRTFYTQWGGGPYDDWNELPIRIFAIKDGNSQTNGVREAGKRIPLLRFAQFLSSHPTFAEAPNRKFVVFEAPALEGERL